jgi:hypothetical protein
MERKKNASERIMDKYLDKLDEKVVQEIVVSFKDPDVEKRLSKAQVLLLVLESGAWKKRDNNYDTRYDNRPINQGGPQLHIRNKHSGNEWAYRSNGVRSERSRFTAPSTRDVRDIVRNYFDLSKDIVIESYVLGFSPDEKQLLVEIDFPG